MKRTSGFTLIELMIAVCIIGVLASVAIPTYNQFIIKSKSTEGLVSLSQLYKGASAYWEMPLVNKGVAATAAGHCVVAGSDPSMAADKAEAAAGMPPLPPTPYKRKVDYAHNAIYAALNFSVADEVYFSLFPISYTQRGECNPGDGPAYAILAACDLDGDGILGGYYLPISVRGDSLTRPPGYKTAANFMYEVLGASCPYCAADVD